MSNISIKIENLSKVYKLYNQNIDRLKEAINPRKKYHKPFYALNNINLTVKKGEILGLVGRNGAGKSTLLKIISGVITPTSGSCVIEGQISPLLGLAVGFNPELTGIENIYMSGTIRSYTRKDMDAKLDDILSFADIGDYVYQPVRTYSSGMNARLSFALAINIAPEILILDEVLSVGDEIFRRKCFARMEELFKSGCTVLFASHSINSVNEICTRVIFMDAGEIILDGPPKLVTMQYMKHMYTSPAMLEENRKEIILLNKDEKKKQEAAAAIPDVEKMTTTEETKSKPGQIPVIKSKTGHQAMYLEAFQSQSTIVQKNEDVDILDSYISDLDRKKVNCLVPGDEYYFTCKVKFNTEITDFVFSWVIKEERGRRLSGASYPAKGKTVGKARKGEIFTFQWKFKNILYNGNFYIDAGINRDINNEKHPVIMNLDAIVFKVQKTEDYGENLSGWGIFQMDQQLISMNSEMQ